MEPDGLMPLDFLMSIVRNDKKDDRVRMEAARAACPYLYPRLSSMVLQAGGDFKAIHKIEIEIVSPED